MDAVRVNGERCVIHLGKLGIEPNNMQDDLIILHLTREASAEEERQLQQWRSHLPENERHYLDVKKVFELSTNHLTQKAEQRLDINVKQEWSKFVNSIEKKETPIRALTPESPSRPWLRIAAALLLLAVSGFVINYFVFKNTDVQFQTADHTLSVALPDGSKVVLNKNSALSYSTSFGEKNRTVILKGEAFFDVQRDAQKPFVIQISDTEVEVLGTSFNVQGYEARKEIEVTVQTGLVKFSVPETNKEIKLEAGQKGIYSKADKDLNSGANEDINFLAWNTSKLIFVENDLRAVIETLNKTYQVNIVLPDTIPGSCVVTVTFDHQTLESVLNVLKTTLNLEYKTNGNQIVIVSAGC